MWAKKQADKAARLRDGWTAEVSGGRTKFAEGARVSMKSDANTLGVLVTPRVEPPTERNGWLSLIMESRKSYPFKQ